MRQRAEGRWQFRVYEGRDPITGKATYRTRSFEGTKTARQVSTGFSLKNTFAASSLFRRKVNRHR